MPSVAEAPRIQDLQASRGDAYAGDGLLSAVGCPSSYGFRETLGEVTGGA